MEVIYWNMSALFVLGLLILGLLYAAEEYFRR